MNVGPPGQVTIPNYVYSVYLNRYCAASAVTVSRSCRNLRSLGKLTDRTYSPNALISQLNPYNFDELNLDIPFTFYILGAISSTLLILTALAALVSGKRWIRITGVTIATVSSFLMNNSYIANATRSEDWGCVNAGCIIGYYISNDSIA